MKKHIEGGISGRILGHNSLVWIKDLAIKLGLKGAVFTKHDGSIKVMAEGEEENLREFEEKIKKGNIFSEVENFYVDWSEPSENLGNFYMLDN